MYLLGMATNSLESPVLASDLGGHRLLTSDEAAEVLRVPVATLRTWRSRRRGYGPPAVHLGGNIRYRPEDLLAWIDAHTENGDGDLPDDLEGHRRGANPPPEHPLTRHRRPRPLSRTSKNNETPG